MSRSPPTPRANGRIADQLPWELLAAATCITRQGDRARLDVELATVLQRLFQPHLIELYQIVQSERTCARRIIELTGGEIRHHVNLSADNDTPIDAVHGARQVLAERRPVAVACGCAGRRALLFPIWNKNRQAVRLLRLDTPDEELHQVERAAQALLELYQNHLNLIEDSELDALTGLRNRRTFDHLLLNLLAGSAAIEQTAGFRRVPCDAASSANWLAVLDIDRFKHINDRYGHLFGDEVLILIANLMHQSFRSDDPLFRFGGEEFVVVLCGVDEHGASTALERFRKRLETQRFPQVGQITISTGFTRIAEGELSSEVLNRADAALYYAKEHGRNRTCCYEKLVADGFISPLQRSAGAGFELF